MAKAWLTAALWGFAEPCPGVGGQDKGDRRRGHINTAIRLFSFQALRGFFPLALGPTCSDASSCYGERGAQSRNLSRRKLKLLLVLFLLFKLNLQRWHWLIKLYRFQSCNPVIHYLYIAPWAQSNLLSSPRIWSPLAFTPPTLLPVLHLQDLP